MFATQSKVAWEMDERNDAHLGTAIKLLHRRGHNQAVNLLLAANDLLWTWGESDWGIEHYDLGIVVDIELFDLYTDEDLFTVIAKPLPMYYEQRNNKFDKLACTLLLFRATGAKT